MRHAFKKYLVRVLVVVGILGLAVHGSMWLLAFAARAIQSGNAEPSRGHVVMSSISRSRSHKAVVFEQDGGGAFAPYCFVFVSVVPATTRDEDAWDESKFVLSASCDGVKFGDWTSVAKWTSDTDLTVTVDSTRGARGIGEMKLRGDALGGKVSVAFEPRFSVTVIPPR